MSDPLGQSQVLELPPKPLRWAARRFVCRSIPCEDEYFPDLLQLPYENRETPCEENNTWVGSWK